MRGAIERFHEFIKGLESQKGDLFYKSITKNTVNFFTQESVATDSIAESTSRQIVISSYSTSYYAKVGSVT